MKCQICKKPNLIMYQHVFIKDKMKKACFECWFKNRQPEEYEKLDFEARLELKLLK